MGIDGGAQGGVPWRTPVRQGGAVCVLRRMLGLRDDSERRNRRGYCSRACVPIRKS